MALDIKAAKRVFIHNDDTLTDPDPNMSPDQVRKFYSNAKPELTNAKVEGPKVTEEGVEYRFTISVGTKG